MTRPVSSRLGFVSLLITLAAALFGDRYVGGVLVVGAAALAIAGLTVSRRRTVSAVALVAASLTALALLL